MSEKLQKGFEDYLAKVAGSLPAEVGGGSGVGLPESGDPNSFDNEQPDPSLDNAEDNDGMEEESEYARLTEFLQDNPDIVKGLGGIDAIIEGLKVAYEGEAGVEQGLEEEGMDSTSGNIELGNKLENILNPQRAEGRDEPNKAEPIS